VTIFPDNIIKELSLGIILADFYMHTNVRQQCRPEFNHLFQAIGKWLGEYACGNLVKRLHVLIPEIRIRLKE
jgi:hypothetical protein